MQLVIFDLDGTLMDAAPAVEAAANRVRERKNLGAVNPQFVKEVLSDSSVENGETALLVDETATGKERRDALMLFGRYLDVVFPDYAFPYEGMITVLEQLKKDGIHMAVVANRITLFLHQWIEYAHMDSYFDLIVGVDSVLKPPPSPEAIHYVLKRLQVAPEQTLVVSDGMPELEAGKQAGTKTAFASYGYGKEAINNVDFLLSKPLDLLEIIRS